MVHIECPQCGFSREMPSDRVPAGPVLATCPRCSHRFRLASPQESSRAASAYAREAERGMREEALENPWDLAPAGDGWILSFCHTLLAIFLRPRQFFQGLRAAAPLQRALIFYIILSIFQSLCERFWAWIFVGSLSASQDPELANLARLLGEGGSLSLALVARTGLLCLQLYFMCAFIYIALRLLAPDRASFPLVFQVCAYSFAPAMLCVVPGLGSLAGVVWGAVLCVLGLRASMRLSWGRCVAAFLPLVIIAALLLMQTLAVLRS